MKYLYTSPLPEASQPTQSNSLAKQLAELGLLEGGDTAVESISSEAADLSLDGQIRWGEEISKLVAAELDELSGSALSSLPLYRDGDREPQEGWYEIASADVEPMHANERSVWEYTLSLTKVGKRASHYRSIRTNRTQLDHPFGNDLTPLIGIPSTAEKVRWFDRSSITRAEATPTSTVATAGVSIDLYDVDTGASALGGAEPELLYDVDYDTDRRAGCRVYDTLGNASKTDADGVRQWQLVHSPQHDPQGSLVLSSLALRLKADEGGNSLTAEQWDSGSSSWSAVSLGSSDWELFEWDVREIAPDRVVSIVEYRDPTQSPTAYYTLRAILHRGNNLVQWDREGLEDTATPNNLQTLLDPIASTSIKDSGETQGLTRRSGVK